MAIKFRDLATFDEGEARLRSVDDCIDTLFGHLAPDEVESLERQYSKTETRMLEIINVRPKGCLVMDLLEDIEFKPVLFPSELMPLLRRHDVFLATMGFVNTSWKILYMSPAYRT